VIAIRPLVLGCLGLTVAACGYSYPSAPPTVPTRVLTTVVLSVADTALEVGQFTTASAASRDQFGDPIDIAGVSFTSSVPEVAGINPVDGRILAVSDGITTITASVGGKASARTVTVVFPQIFINEVAPFGAADSGWVELYNPTNKPIDLTGWTVTNADIFRPAAIAAGSIIPARGFLAIEERNFPNGLPDRETVHLFSRFGVQSDAFVWGHDPVTSFGRCPDGESGLIPTAIPTKAAPNRCP
jgi:hypothetical protein